MDNLIRDDTPVVADDWTLVEAADLAQAPAHGRLLVPLAAWLERGAALRERNQPCGVWLAPDEEPEVLSGAFDGLSLIAVHFPVFSDGRGYSIARILRERLGWQGELRAFGDVLRDQLVLMRRCGFDSFQLRADRDPAAAAEGLRDFSQVYQQATRDPAPPLLGRRNVP